MGEFKVAIDAGHGSNTAGKRTAPFLKNIDIDGDGKIDVKKGEQFREHYANVGVAYLLDKELKRCGIETVKVAWDDSDSKDDEDVSLTARQKKIKKSKCDVSVSIHFNAAGNGKVFNSGEGIGTYYHTESCKDSKKLAEKVQAQLIKGTKQKDRGIKQSMLAMCNCKAMGTDASILVELAFMTNAKEAQEMVANTKYWKESAKEIAKGICGYFGTEYIEDVKKVENKTEGKAEEKKETKEFKIKVVAKELNVRKTPEVKDGNIIQIIKKDEVFTITEEKGNWGKLKSGAGWINLSEKYCKRV